jgi:hypothetical protein
LKKGSRKKKIRNEKETEINKTEKKATKDGKE